MKVYESKKVWGHPELQTKVYEYLVEHSRVDPILKELREETAKKNKTMGTLIDQLPILNLLVKLVDPKIIIDVGTFTGISALQLALAVSDEGRVITIDKNDSYLPLAKTYWEKAQVAHKIEARLGNAIDVLEDLKTSLQRTVDLAFIDADKANNDIYYEKLIEMVRPGGLIIVDNTLWYGQVADEKVVNKVTQKIRDFNDKAFNDPRIDFALIPAADGMAACRVL